MVVLSPSWPWLLLPQVERRNGAVSGNNVSGYDYTPNTAAAIGILIFSAGSMSVTNNNVHDIMEGMYVQQTNNATVTGTSSRTTATRRSSST